MTNSRFSGLSWFSGNVLVDSTASQGRNHGGMGGVSPPKNIKKIMSWQNRVELITLTQ